MSEQRRISRRSSLAVLLGTAAGSAALSPPAAAAALQTTPAGVGLPGATSDAEAALRRNSEALAKVDVPADTEPAFRFQA